LSVSIDLDLRNRVRATASLLGMTMDEYVGSTLQADVERRGLINERAMASASA